ncbi:MAG: ECF transporter S component [Oscillospiraceae bacterium]|jgi:hypothetical protein|nr:ECF transporter S component [Oscillospiraceae bacterium]
MAVTLDKKTLFVTRTAVFTALLVVLQFAAAQLGNQFITGSVVNLVLIMSGTLCGFASGAVVAAIAPVFVRLLGVGLPFWPLVPFIALGNTVLVAVWCAAERLGERARNARFIVVARVAALPVAAVLKTAALYAGVVLFAAPVLLGLRSPQLDAVTLAYSWPQIVTAGIAGAIAVALLPLFKRTLKK